MNIIVCVEDRLGMSFAGRRCSRDSAVMRKISEICDNEIYISPYSEPLFKEYGIPYKTAENYLDIAGKNDYCFVERDDISSLSAYAEKIIIFKWNRKYPFDVSFPEKLLDNKNKADVCEFKGSSHDKITMEVYE